MMASDNFKITGRKDDEGVHRLWAEAARRRERGDMFLQLTYGAGAAVRLFPLSVSFVAKKTMHACAITAEEEMSRMLEVRERNTGLEPIVEEVKPEGLRGEYKEDIKRFEVTDKPLTITEL